MKYKILPVLIIFCFLIFSPAFLNNEKKDEEKKPVEEVFSYTEPFISLLDRNDNSIVGLPLETYLLGVVSAEVPASFYEDAIKAQTVAARTYAIGKLSSPAHENAHICTDSTCCCAYAYPDLYPYGEENLNKIKKAIEDTKGEIITYEKEPILAVFHSMSAGKTEEAENVWGQSVPYLVSVDSPLEEAIENFETEVFIPFSVWDEKIKSVATNATLDTHLIKDISYSPAGYVSHFYIDGEKFSGSTIRSLFSLRSTAFSITTSDEGITFLVKGYGHGVGLSQHGANLLAEEGKNYRDILKTYYKGVDISIYQP